MKSYFLITSYTGGQHRELKTVHLIKFLKQIKKYIDNSFIIVVDGHYSHEVEKFCDIFLYKKENANTPHGMGELSQIKLGLLILDYYNVKSFTKFNYDFWFNENIYKKYLEWQDLVKTKKIVSARWKLDEKDPGMANSIACAFGVYQLEAAKELFDYSQVIYPIEQQIYNRAFEIFNSEDIYLYPDFMKAFGEECFDIFNDGGEIYSQSRLDLINYENF